MYVKWSLHRVNCKNSLADHQGVCTEAGTLYKNGKAIMESFLYSELSCTILWCSVEGRCWVN